MGEITDITSTCIACKALQDIQELSEDQIFAATDHTEIHIFPSNERVKQLNTYPNFNSSLLIL